MTDRGTFLGGGSPGSYYSWSIPDIQGKSHGFRGQRDWGADGCMTYSNIGTEAFGGGKDAEWHKWHIFNINLLSTYSGHTNQSGDFYPNHYGVEYWIKYR